MGFNGKDFPDWDPATCSKEAVEGLNNILQFKVVELTTANMPAKDEEETDISYRLRCMAQVIKMVPNEEGKLIPRVSFSSCRYCRACRWACPVIPREEV